jgi:membrane protein
VNETDADAAPSDRHRLSFAEWKSVGKRTISQFMADDCMGLSQEVAYSALLAFFPTVAFILGFLGLVHLYDDVQIFLATIVPHGVIKFIEGLQQDSQGSASVAAFVIGLGVAIWAASGAMRSVIKAVNRAYNQVETRPFWKVRLISIVLVLLTGTTLAALLVLVIFGGPLGRAIASKANLGSEWDVLWGLLRWPLAFAAVLVFFALVYYLAPNVESHKWRWVTAGSVLGSVIWLILSGGFALYVTFAGSYSKTYGALATGVILLLWLNYSAWALLFGAELDSEVDRQADIRAAGRD